MNAYCTVMWLAVFSSFIYVCHNKPIHLLETRTYCIIAMAMAMAYMKEKELDSVHGCLIHGEI
jgi:hypothetical protein